jgi:hypothetical protein
MDLSHHHTVFPLAVVSAALYLQIDSPYTLAYKKEVVWGWGVK